MKRLNVIVVDDHPIFRQGLVDALSLDETLCVVDQAGDGEEALRKIRQLAPDVAVVDVNLPILNGQQVVRQVTSEKLPTRLILLTAYDDPEQLLHAFRGGAAAYSSKDIEPEGLIGIIHHVADGKYVVGGQLLTKAGMERWLATQAEQSTGSYWGDPYSPLSEREMEVLIYITKGMSNKDIGVRLGISHQTVKNHVTSILRKLCVQDRTQAALYALQRGWVRLHQQKSQH